MMKRRLSWIGATGCLALITLAVWLPLATTAGAAQAEQYAVLNPRADLPSIKATPLTPRLDSLEGKTVYVVGMDALQDPGNEIMLMVARGLAKTVPGVKVVYLSDRYGDATSDSVVPSIQIIKRGTNAHDYSVPKEAEKNADAVVTGLGY